MMTHMGFLQPSHLRPRVGRGSSSYMVKFLQMQFHQQLFQPQQLFQQQQQPYLLKFYAMTPVVLAACYQGRAALQYHFLFLRILYLFFLAAPSLSAERLRRLHLRLRHRLRLLLLLWVLHFKLQRHPSR